MHQCGVVVGVSILVLLDGGCDDDGEEVVLTRGDGWIAKTIEEDRGTNQKYDNTMIRDIQDDYTIFTVRM
jgi:hypothetical protein